MLCKNAELRGSRESISKPIVVAVKFNFPCMNFSVFFCVRLRLREQQIHTKQRKLLNLPHTMSKVHSFMNGRISKLLFPASLSNLSTMLFVFPLKIGTNDCKIFELNDGFISFRIGFQNEPA